MNLVSEALNQYINKNSSPEDPILKELFRETQLKVLMPQMISGHTQGIFLKMISNMIQPKSILEIGTFTGYSAICLASGLKEEGILTTIDINDELESIAKKYFIKSGLDKKINMILGDAQKIIPSINQEFDLVFIDADKKNYALYYDLVFDKVRKGGFILADNVLWNGKVINPDPDKDTQNIIDFNAKIANDKRVESVIISLRDGITVIRKI
jgi:caffeoyl-CoA O-methyltransferase